MRHQLLILAFAPAVLIAGEAAATQELLLNGLDTAAMGESGAWRMERLSTRLATAIEPRFGAAAVEVRGLAQIAGAKADVGLSRTTLPGCRRLALWVHLSPDSNVREVGLQVTDARGERLVQTVPADWTGWRQIAIDPAGGGLKQAFEQQDQDGKIDWPIRAVHLTWFTAAPGPASLAIDGLVAITDAGKDDGAALHVISGDVLEPGTALDLRLVAENHGAAERVATVRWTLQADPALAEPEVPDPVLGYDHARGCTSAVIVDGRDCGDARLCDGDEFTAFEPPYGKDYGEAVATIDLGRTREVRGVRWQPSDANWIWKADISVSTDGAAFTAVPGAQGVDMHKRWLPQSFPWPAAPVAARHLRFRFHNDGKTGKSIHLPASIMIYDGIANDAVAIPSTGPLVASGTASCAAPPHSLAELRLRSGTPIGTGGYLLGLEREVGGVRTVDWRHLFVRPADLADTGSCGRFGINVSDPACATEMRRCGFGWVRFENAKWRFFNDAKGHFAFDGSIGPWFVSHDRLFADYQQRGMRVLPYVFQTPDWASSAPPEAKKNKGGYPPKDDADYAEAVFQFAARFGGAAVDPGLLKSADRRSGLRLIDAIELWNEPNLNAPEWGFYVGSLDRFFETMRAGAEAVRRADPRLTVSAAGFAGIDLAVVGRLAEYAYANGRHPIDLVDVVNVHFYSGRQDPEVCGWDPNVDRDGQKPGRAYPDQLEDLVAWRDQVKPQAGLWLTETGNDVGGPMGRSERAQAGKVPRVTMIALAAGVDKVMIYREKGSDPAQHAGAGLLRNDMSLRPVWFTVATMIRQLQGFGGRAIRLPHPDHRVWLLLWRDEGRQLVTAWTIGGPGSLGIDLGKATVCDAFGRSSEVASTAEVVISDLPTYLTPAGGAALDHLIAGAQERAREHAAERARLAATPAVLFDFGPDGQTVGVLKGYGLPRRYTAVGKDAVWDEARGYGFTAPALAAEEAKWNRDPLERDACRLGKGGAFRFRLPAGRFRLEVSAAPFGERDALIIRAPAGERSCPITKDQPRLQLEIEGGEKPVEIVATGYCNLRSVTAIGIAPH